MTVRLVAKVQKHDRVIKGGEAGRSNTMEHLINISYKYLAEILRLHTLITKYRISGAWATQSKHYRINQTAGEHLGQEGQLQGCWHGGMTWPGPKKEKMEWESYLDH